MNRKKKRKEGRVVREETIKGNKKQRMKSQKHVKIQKCVNKIQLQREEACKVRGRSLVLHDETAN